MEGEVSRAFVGIVCKVDIGDFGERRTRVFGKRVERQAIDNYCENLGVSVRGWEVW